MDILAIKTGPIETFHQPIHQMAGAMGTQLIITLDKWPNRGHEIASRTRPCPPRRSVHSRGHDKGWHHGEDLTALLQTKPATPQLRFTGGSREAIEGIAPSKGRRKPFGMLLVEFLKPGLRISAILDKPILFELTQGQTDRAVSFS